MKFVLLKADILSNSIDNVINGWAVQNNAIIRDWKFNTVDGYHYVLLSYDEGTKKL